VRGKVSFTIYLKEKENENEKETNNKQDKNPAK
jgi:hypothetical protein